MSDWLAEHKARQVDPVQVPCPCGCGAEGALRRKVMSDGLRHVARRCRCNRCQGSRNRLGGLDKQRQARKALGVPDGFSMVHEELWRDAEWRHEIKAGDQVGPAARQFLRMEKQAEARRAIGDSRPFLGTVIPSGDGSWGGDGIVMMRLTVWKKLKAEGRL